MRDGTTLRVRLFLPENIHQMANVALAGVRSAKAASRQGEVAEPWGEEVSHIYLLGSTFQPLCRQNFSLNPVFYKELSVFNCYPYSHQLPSLSRPLLRLLHPHQRVCLLGQCYILLVILPSILFLLVLLELLVGMLAC